MDDPLSPQVITLLTYEGELELRVCVNPVSELGEGEEDGENDEEDDDKEEEGVRGMELMIWGPFCHQYHPMGR